MTDWNKLTTCCQTAMQAAAEKPGRYGGLYVGRVYDKATQQTEFIVLNDDDPELVPQFVDVLAQVTPTKVFALGGAQRYLREDGSVVFE